MEEVGLPVIIRPAYILGGRGTGIASTIGGVRASGASYGLECSPISEILIEESITGWKEFELEVMRDSADNCVIICSIENFDPMGVHTGDSITVAPAQTLTDVEYQQMRDGSFACIRRVGVETGGSNVQWAVHPDDGRQVIIEMNPRVSRSSALASKATGFPIAKIAAKLAVGYTLDEIPNDITEKTPASVRAIDRLCGHQGAAVGVREVPGHQRVCSARRCSRSVRSWRSVAPSPNRSRRRFVRSSRDVTDSTAIRVRRCSTSVETDDRLLNLAAAATPDRPFQLETLLRRGVSIDKRSTRPPGSIRGSSTRCSSSPKSATI